MTDIPGFVAHFHYLGIFILLVLGGVGFPFPEGIILMLCGFLISQELMVPVYALGVVFIGMLTGDLIIFSFGRKYGRAVVTHRRFRRFLTPQRLSSLENAFNRKKFLVILFGRYLGSSVFLVAGIMRVSYLKFIELDIASSVLAMGALVGAGYLGGRSLRVLQRDITRIEHAVILSAVVLLAAYLAVRYLKSRRG
ncbi:MAG: DedA family protein [Candidatus Aminicenantales bacterium]